MQTTTAKPASTIQRSRKADFGHRLHQKAFNALYNRSLLYNACWEDPAIDRIALKLGAQDRVLVITSAGCNALDYCLAGPARVDAVDANPMQTALLELKIAGILSLDYDDFFQIFGLGQHRAFPDLYRTHLRQHLTPVSRRIWDRRQRWFNGQGWRSSLYYQGLSGLVARVFRSYIDHSPALRRGVEGLLSAQCMEEQRKFYDAVEPLLFNRVVRWVLERQITMSLLGVPYAQRQEVQASHADGVAGFVRDCLDTVCRQLPFATNYHWSVYLRGTYTRTCCPEYLKEANFDLLRSRINTVHAHTTTVTDFLERHDQEVTRFVLLDHMDWMGHYYPDALAEEWQAIFARSAKDSRILFRSGARRPAFIDSLPIPAQGGPVYLKDRLQFHDRWASELHRQDRVHTYTSFHIADIGNVPSDTVQA